MSKATIKMICQNKGKQATQEVTFDKCRLRLRAKENNPSQTWEIHPQEPFFFKDGEIHKKEIKKPKKDVLPEKTESEEYKD